MPFGSGSRRRVRARRWSGSRLVASVALVALLAVACGTPSEVATPLGEGLAVAAGGEDAAAAAAPDTGPEAVAETQDAETIVEEAAAQAVSLPELPSRHERQPELYDENDCLYIPPDEGGGVDCGLPADVEALLEEMEAASLADPDVEVTAPVAEWRSLGGFVGPYYAETVSGSGIEVLEGTVSTAAAGNWSAQGLVRNELPDVVGSVSVTAELFDADGNSLGTATGATAVANTRPGEPAPFAIAADVPAVDVASVAWGAVAAPGQTVDRNLEIRVFRVHPAGDRPAVDAYFHTDTGEGPYPFVLFGSVTNYGAALADGAVAVAWLDPDGRVVWTERVDVKSPADTTTIAAGGIADFVVVVDDPAAPDLYQLDAMFWGVGR